MSTRHCHYCEATLPPSAAEPEQGPGEAPSVCGHCGSFYDGGDFMDLCPCCAAGEEGLADLATRRAA